MSYDDAIIRDDLIHVLKSKIIKMEIAKTQLTTIIIS